MRVRALLSVFALLLILSVSANALEKRCVVVGPAGSELKALAREAAQAQRLADELEAYLRNASPHRATLAGQMAQLEDRIRTLRGALRRFEHHEPKLTEAQKHELERLRTALATLTLVANQANRTLAEQEILTPRERLMAQARAMRERAAIIRQSARNLRTLEAA